jgi:hypothetical protein
VRIIVAVTQGRITFCEAGCKTLVLHEDLERLIAGLPTVKIRQQQSI